MRADEQSPAIPTAIPTRYVLRPDLTDLIMIRRRVPLDDHRRTPNPTEDEMLFSRLLQTLPPPLQATPLLLNPQPTPLSNKATISEDMRALYKKESAAAAARRLQAAPLQARLAALGTARDKLIPTPTRLLPHDIPVITLDGRLTEEALQKLLANECCAVHVRGFLGHGVCAEIASRLQAHSAAFSNWYLNKEEAEKAEVPSEGTICCQAKDAERLLVLVYVRMCVAQLTSVPIESA